MEQMFAAKMSLPVKTVPKYEYWRAVSTAGFKTISFCFRTSAGPKPLAGCIMGNVVFCSVSYIKAEFPLFSQAILLRFFFF